MNRNSVECTAANTQPKPYFSLLSFSILFSLVSFLHSVPSLFIHTLLNAVVQFSPFNVLIYCASDKRGFIYVCCKSNLFDFHWHFLSIEFCVFVAIEILLFIHQMDASTLLATESILLQKTNNKNLAAVTSLSAHCSPVSNKRHKLNTSTASLASSCSSQVNNNYTTGIDMNSLEDMLRKVRLFTI